MEVFDGVWGAKHVQILQMLNTGARDKVWWGICQETQDSSFN
jgi:hypothetical protein